MIGARVQFPTMAGAHEALVSDDRKWWQALPWSASFRIRWSGSVASGPSKMFRPSAIGRVASGCVHGQPSRAWIRRCTSSLWPYGGVLKWGRPPFSRAAFSWARWLASMLSECWE